MDEQKWAAKHWREPQTSDPDRTSAGPRPALPWLGRQKSLSRRPPHTHTQPAASSVGAPSQLFPTLWARLPRPACCSSLSSPQLAAYAWSSALALPKDAPGGKTLRIPSLEGAPSSIPHFADHHRGKLCKGSHLTPLPPSDCVCELLHRHQHPCAPVGC